MCGIHPRSVINASIRETYRQASDLHSSSTGVTFRNEKDDSDVDRINRRGVSEKSDQ